MASYLPKDSNAGSAYQEGGGLYALGKILADFTFTDRSINPRRPGDEDGT